MTVVKRQADHVQTLATVGATTHTLTVNDAGTIIFTGTAAGDIAQLPDATKLLTGEVEYRIINTSTQDVEVRDAASTVLATIPPGFSAQYVLSAGGSTAGSWVTWTDSTGFYPFSITGVNATADVSYFTPQEDGTVTWKFFVTRTDSGDHMCEYEINAHYDLSANTAEFRSVKSTDKGSTAGIAFDVYMATGSVRLRATVTAGTWSLFGNTLQVSSSTMQTLGLLSDGTTIEGTGLAGNPFALIEVATVATVTDTVIPLTATQAPLTVLTGTASGAIVRTPDATSMPVGWTRRIKNISSEFVKIDNGAGGTLFKFIAKGATIELTLTAASAAGTWDAAIYSPPVGKLFVFEEDFFRNGLNFEKWSKSIGTGATVDANTAFSTGAVGYFYQYTGTSSATANASLTMGQAIRIGAGSVMVRSRVKPLQLPTAGEDYVYEIGLVLNAPTTPELTNGILFRVPANASGLSTWQAYTYLASTPTAVASAITPDINNMVNLTMVINANGTRVDFWINKTYIGKSEANLPAGTTSLYLSSKNIKTVGTAASNVQFDYVQIEAVMDRE